MFFDPITVKVPVEKVYARLGYQKRITQLTSREKRKIDSCLDEAFSLLQLKGAAQRISIKENYASSVILSNGVYFESKLLATLLKDCQEILCMGATGGEKIIEAISDSKQKNLTKGVIFDAVASETVDACFFWIQDYFNRQLQRENKKLIAKRISCGYGDFSIKYQKSMYDILQLQSLGLSLNEKYLLIPEKSATAVTGIIRKI